MTNERVLDFTKGKAKQPIQIGGNSGGSGKPVSSEIIQKQKPNTILKDSFVKKHKVRGQGK